MQQSVTLLETVPPGQNRVTTLSSAKDNMADSAKANAGNTPLATKADNGYEAFTSLGCSGNREIADGSAIDLNDPRVFLNRELTWLNFNRRVLYEAESTRNPLLERLKFIAIASSNTDQFFMKRIGGLKQLVEANVTEPSVDGRTPSEQIEQCYQAAREVEVLKSAVFSRLLRSLKSRGVCIKTYQELSQGEIEKLRTHFIDNIFPIVIPQGLGPAHPFPFISNLSLNILVTLRHRNHGEQSLARVKVPIGPDVSRFIRIHDDKNHFVTVEDVIRNNMDLLFPGVDILATDLFRVTRNANTEKDEELADDLLELIESEIRERKFAPVVRVQVEKHTSESIRRTILKALELDERDLFEIEGFISKADLFELADLNIANLHYKPFIPIDPPRFKSSEDIFHSLRRHGDILVFHPYESFSSSVERFLREAAKDPKVRAIKMTLYRTSGESKVIDYLLEAVRNGKQVAVVVELKARFDEAANIEWASRLEEEGIHVTYGVIGFKTHVKVILVTRKDHTGFRTYCHIGTGNYHANNARLYTDLGLFTADHEIGRDMVEIFNFLTTGYTPTRKYNKVLMAPSTMKKELLNKVEREIKHHTENGDGLIRMKLNALEDSHIVQALYKASRAGVKVDLIIRDTCRLRPGIPGLSENINVYSVLGRFLEHFRLYFFRNGGDEEIFIGSADAMKRNLEHRVEVLAPVNDASLKKDLKKIINLQISPSRRKWILQPDGSYILPKNQNHFGLKDSQLELLRAAERRRKESEKIRKVDSKGKSKKEFWSPHLKQ